MTRMPASVQYNIDTKTCRTSSFEFFYSSFSWIKKIFTLQDFDEHYFRLEVAKYKKQFADNIKEFDIPSDNEQKMAFFEAFRLMYKKQGVKVRPYRSIRKKLIKRISKVDFTKPISHYELNLLLADVVNIQIESPFKAYNYLRFSQQQLLKQAVSYSFASEILEHGLGKALKHSGLIRNNRRYENFKTFFQRGIGLYLKEILINAPIIIDGSPIPLFFKTPPAKIFNKGFNPNVLEMGYSDVFRHVEGVYGQKLLSKVKTNVILNTYTYFAVLSYLLFLSDHAWLIDNEEAVKAQIESAQLVEDMTSQMDNQVAGVTRFVEQVNAQGGIGCMIFENILEEYKKQGVTLKPSSLEYQKLQNKYCQK